ncbi:Hypothetical Protein FCC1311_046302 [Hondaea fermentalgiana]|uniref:Uncharacterized protein n=1 Tax=Hondaea fermentalgiana TaxID=2315210 RepID=A0A2R5GBP9_9STRA|nr:Hypothetical Protein FCC1311_046302 [Hondaea fermentalgiana]|eukprot:GBG28407.1 Hypothetical Protein FCC1311_046302 [Hondaea fermentalgiana]
MTDTKSTTVSEDDMEEKTRRRVLPLPSLSFFYLSPYLTCGECNSIAFINSRTVEKALVRLSEFEQRQLERAERSRLAAEEAKLEEKDNSDVEESFAADDDNDDDEDDDDNVDEGGEKADKELDEEETETDALHGLELEALPRCPGCQRTHTWFVGALDLSSHIAGNAKERRRQKRLMRKCAIRLQALVRGIRDRARASRIRKEKREHEALLFRSAARIAAVFRGRRDRRVARVERGLRRIDGTHKIVMMEALRPRKGMRVFWYKRKEEIKLLHRDYRILVERTGNDPPLHIVEKNIIELARRVHEIECQRAARIQCRVRGMIGRKIAQADTLRRSVVAAYRRDVQVSRAGRMMVPGFVKTVSLVAQSQRTIRQVKALQQQFDRPVREEKEREAARTRERAEFCERKCEEREERRPYFEKDFVLAAKAQAAVQGPVRRSGVTTASFMRELEKYKRTQSRVAGSGSPTKVAKSPTRRRAVAKNTN